MEFKYSPKQLDFINKVVKNELGFVNILEGSVRSGKTFIVNLGWVLFILNSPGDVFLMSGESTDSLYRNIIKDMLFILGEDRATYQDSAKGGAQLVIKYNNKTKICYCRGASKVSDEGKIRGTTIYGWYADEVTLHHKTFINQALARMSGEGAKALWTTNPDSPFHFVKTDYIDVANEKGYLHWHFSLDDNFTLSEEYKNSIKNAYSGVFYDRFIKGLWVLSDGIIYDMFNKDIHVVPTENRKYSKRVVSIDYGTLNPTTFGMYSKDLTGQWYKEKEYHYSGRDTKKQKTDEEFADELEKFIDGDKEIKIIVDPSAASFITTLRKRGFNVRQAINNVLDGIRNVGAVIKNRRILFNDCNIETFKEFETYIWDEKASLLGEDKPIKENDHHLDNLRYFTNTVLIKADVKPYKEEVVNKGKGVVKPSKNKYKGTKGGVF